MSDYRNPLTDYSPQMETSESHPEKKFMADSSSQFFNEDEEIELASELLEVNNEHEFEQFVDSLIHKGEQT